MIVAFDRSRCSCCSHRCCRRPISRRPDAAAAGKAPYDRVCSVCHGPDAHGDAGPGLVPLEHDLDEVMVIVREGRGQMPPVSAERLTDDEIKSDRRTTSNRSNNAVAAEPGPMAPIRPAVDAAAIADPVTSPRIAARPWPEAARPHVIAVSLFSCLITPALPGSGASYRGSVC